MPKPDQNPDHAPSPAGLPTKKGPRTQGQTRAPVHTVGCTGEPEITLVEVPALELKRKRKVFEVAPLGGIDAFFHRGRFDDRHASWCVHPVGDAHNAIKHVSRLRGPPSWPS